MSSGITQEQIDAMMERAEGAMTRMRGVMKTGSSVPVDVQAQRLRDHYADISRKYEFKPGDLVRFKAGLGGFWSLPSEGQPAIVTKTFAPVFDEHATAGSAHFLRQHDIILMVLDSDGDAIEYAFDSRYFEPIDGSS